MTTKRKSILTLISIALVTLLCLSMALPILAGSPSKSDKNGEAEAALTKIFKLPNGTTIPTVTFEFEITKVSLDGESTDNDKDDMPEIDNQIINFFSDDSFELGDNGKTKVISKESESIFDGVEWERAGVYRYHIAEIQEHTPAFDDPDFAEIMTYSKAEYDLEVYVDIDENGDFFIAFIAAYIMVTEEGIETNGEEKVDPTPSWRKVNTEDLSHMTFTNTYIKNNGTIDPPDPEDEIFTLKISKITSGLSANNDYPFHFTVTVTAPSIIDGTPKYKAYLMDKNGIISPLPTESITNINPNDIGTDDEGNQFIWFTSDIPHDGYLKHGQWLNFTDLPVGATFTIVETGVSKYTPSCDLTAFSGKINDYQTATIQGTNGNSLTIPNSGFGTSFIGELDNIAAFNNMIDTITPTGISVNDLPYVVLIGIAVAALVAFVAFKSRKKEETDA